MTRDNQRARVYASTWVGPNSKLWVKHIKHPDDPYKTSIAEVEDYVDAVLKLRGFQSRFGQRSVDVRPGHGRISAAGGYGRIWLPMWSRNEHTVLHEVAHAINPIGDRHGPRYVGTLVTLVRLVCGPEAARSLREALKRNRARVSFKSVPKPNSERVVTQKVERDRKRARDESPVGRQSIGSAASILRKLIDFGYFGKPGRKPRAHAAEVVRNLNSIVASGVKTGRQEFSRLPKE